MAHGSAAGAEPEGDSRRKGKQLDRKSPGLQGSEAVGWLSWDWGQGLCVAMGKGSASQAAGHPAFTASGPDLTLCRHLLASPTCQVTEMTALPEQSVLFHTWALPRLFPLPSSPLDGLCQLSSRHISVPTAPYPQVCSEGTPVLLALSGSGFTRGLQRQ